MCAQVQYPFQRFQNTRPPSFSFSFVCRIIIPHLLRLVKPICCIGKESTATAVLSFSLYLSNNAFQCLPLCINALGKGDLATRTDKVVLGIQDLEIGVPV